MFTNLISVLHDEEGATLVEYGLIVALIAAVSIVAIKTLGTSVLGAFTKINTSI